MGKHENSNCVLRRNLYRVGRSGDEGK